MKQMILTRKWNIVNDNLNANYHVENEIVYYREVLKSHLWDYNNASVLVRGDITVTAASETEGQLKIVHHSLNLSQKLMKKQ